FTIGLQENYGAVFSDKVLSNFFNNAYAEINSQGHALASAKDKIASTSPPATIELYRSLFSEALCAAGGEGAALPGCAIAVKWAADWLDIATERYVVDPLIEWKDREAMRHADEEMLSKLSQMRSQRPILANSADVTVGDVLRVKTADAPSALLENAAAD